MEPENSVMLESCGEDSILIQTVKNMVNETTHNELESEEGEFFVVTDVENEQQNVMEVSNEESIVTQSDEQFSWSNLCRVCANTSDHLIPIFEGEGLQHDLCNKIHKYLPLHISENDTLPLQLCYHCAATLLAWHELLEGCLNAERRLLEMQDALQDKQASDGLETSTHNTSVSIAESLQQQQETVKDEVSGELAVNDSDRSIYFGVYTFSKRLYTRKFMEDSQAPPFFVSLILAQSSSIFAISMTYPLDTLSRQKMLWSGRGTKHYVTVRQMISIILKKDGPIGFYKGISANLMSTICGALLLVTYDIIKKRFDRFVESKRTKSEN